MSTPSTERDRVSSPHSVQPDKTLAVDHGASVPADVNSQMAELTARHCKDTDFVTSLARGIAVTQALADKRRRMSMAQISHITGIPRAAVRLCAAFSAALICIAIVNYLFLLGKVERIEATADPVLGKLAPEVRTVG